MNPRQRAGRVALLAAALLLALPVVVLFVAGPFVMFGTRSPSVRLSVDRAMISYWAAWLPFLPAMVVATRRWPLRQAANASTWVVHLLLLAVIPALHAAAFQLIEQAPASSLVIIAFVGTAHYLVIAALLQAVYFSRRSSDSELAAEELSGELARVRLAALQAQLQPHFLFNTLNSISVLIAADPARAQEMLGKLSTLLRAVLSEGDAAEVPLRRELDFVRGYLEIEQIRFESRLTVRLDADPRTLDDLVPTMMLQPLVENSVRHAVAARDGGTVWVRSTRESERLVISVEDDGPGIAGGGADPGHGIGIANLRARLARLYGDAHRFHLDPAGLGGLAVTLSIPARQLGGADAPR